jgi:hypothetical protein
MLRVLVLRSSGANKTMNQGLEPKETPYVHMVLLTGMLAPMRNAALDSR